MEHYGPSVQQKTLRQGLQMASIFKNKKNIYVCVNLEKNLKNVLKFNTTCLLHRSKGNITLHFLLRYSSVTLV